jgi:hypothetical protein
MGWYVLREELYHVSFSFKEIPHRGCTYEERTLLSKFAEVPLDNLAIRLQPAHLSFGICHKQGVLNTYMIELTSCYLIITADSPRYDLCSKPHRRV